MPTRKAPPPAVRITLANGSTVVAGRHSLAKLLELTFSSRPQPATRRATPRPAKSRPAATRPAATRQQPSAKPGSEQAPAASSRPRRAA
jgi:hypothetical protein